MSQSEISKRQYLYKNQLTKKSKVEDNAPTPATPFKEGNYSTNPAMKSQVLSNSRIQVTENITSEPASTTNKTCADSPSIITECFMETQIMVNSESNLNLTRNSKLNTRYGYYLINSYIRLVDSKILSAEAAIKP